MRSGSLQQERLLAGMTTEEKAGQVTLIAFTHMNNPSANTQRCKQCRQILWLPLLRVPCLYALRTLCAQMALLDLNAFIVKDAVSGGAVLDEPKLRQWLHRYRYIT
jgi:hypothetical protein